MTAFRLCVLAGVVGIAGPALAEPVADDGCSPADIDYERPFDVVSCAAWEGMAVGYALTGVALIAFGVATLAVSPTFANVPLPLGVTGIGLGLFSLAAALYLGIAAPWLPHLGDDEGTSPPGADGAPDEAPAESDEVALRF